MTVMAVAHDHVSTAGHQDAWQVLKKLRAEGWRVRFKHGRPSRAERFARTRQQAAKLASGTPRTQRQVIDAAIRAAIVAYRRAIQKDGERGLPCRAALEAYQEVHPTDSRSSERIVAALVLALKHNPAAFVPAQKLAS